MLSLWCIVAADLPKLTLRPSTNLEESSSATRQDDVKCFQGTILHHGPGADETLLEIDRGLPADHWAFSQVGKRSIWGAANHQRFPGTINLAGGKRSYL
jgi:hypothetical protein